MFVWLDLILSHNRDVIGGNMWVGEAKDLVFSQPVLIYSKKITGFDESLRAGKDVVNHALEVMGNVGVRDVLLTDGTLETKRVGVVLVGVLICVDTIENHFIAERFQIRMSLVDDSSGQILDNSRIRKRVEITSNNQRNFLKKQIYNLKTLKRKNKKSKFKYLEWKSCLL